MKNKPIKIRRTWTRHPAERIKENKKKEDLNPCKGCKYFLTIECDYCDNLQLGGA